MNRPRLSYWICWSARRGGTLLRQVLASTGVAGDPTEWFWPPEVEELSRRWGVEKGTTPPRPERAPRYVFDAIDHLVAESVLLDCHWQQLFTEWGVSPLALVFEDFVKDLEGTARTVIDYLGIEEPWELREDRIVSAVQADALSEEWVQRYRAERQQGWENVAW